MTVLNEIEQLNERIKNCKNDLEAIELQAKVLELLETLLKEGEIKKEIITNKRN